MADTPEQVRIRAELKRVNDLEKAVGGLGWAQRAAYRKRRGELWQELETEKRRIERAAARR